MKFKLVIALSFIAISGMVNLPFVPAPVRIIHLSLANIPSMLASGVSFWYYHNFPEAKYTVLTTAAKSVVVWHTVVSLTVYFDISTYHIFWNELEADLSVNASRTSICPVTSILVSNTIFTSAVLEFQVLRTWFEMNPFQVIALNHDLLAYPLVALVPIISGLYLLAFYLKGVALCNKTLLKGLGHKVNVNIVQENFDFPDLDPRIIQIMLVVTLELFIRIRRNWNTIVQTCLVRRNTVAVVHIIGETNRSSEEISQVISFQLDLCIPRLPFGIANKKISSMYMIISLGTMN